MVMWSLARVRSHFIFTNLYMNLPYITLLSQHKLLLPKELLRSSTPTFFGFWFCERMLGDLARGDRAARLL